MRHRRSGPARAAVRVAIVGSDRNGLVHVSPRSGFDPNEPTISVAPPLAWASDALDGQIYAEPLVGGRVLIAAENDTVYALDATSGHLAAGWTAPVHLGTPVPLHHSAGLIAALSIASPSRVRPPSTRRAESSTGRPRPVPLIARCRGQQAAEKH